MAEQSNSRLGIYLIISIVINALLLGFVLGGGLGVKQGDRQGLRPDTIGSDEFSLARGIERSLDPESRDAVRSAFRDAFDETRTERRAVRAARRELQTLLTADPYDSDAVAQAFEAIRENHNAAQIRLQEELSQQLSKLSQEQRRDILENISTRRERGPRRFERDNGDRRPPPPRPED